MQKKRKRCKLHTEGKGKGRRVTRIQSTRPQGLRLKRKYQRFWNADTKVNKNQEGMSKLNSKLNSKDDGDNTTERTGTGTERTGTGTEISKR